MFVPGVNGSIIANSNAPSGSRLKGAYKNSKKRKMPNGGLTYTPYSRSQNQYTDTPSPKPMVKPRVGDTVNPNYQKLVTDLAVDTGSLLPGSYGKAFNVISKLRATEDDDYTQGLEFVPGKKASLLSVVNDVKKISDAKPYKYQGRKMPYGGLASFKEPQQKSLLPSWLKTRSVTPYQLNDLSPNSKMVGNLNDYNVGDVSEDKNTLFKNATINLSTQKKLKGSMGRLDIGTTLSPFKDKKFTSPDITYSNSIGNSKRSADLRVTPENQTLSLSNNSLIRGNVNLNRNITPSGLINSLDANLEIPYTGVTVGRSVTTRPGETPMSEELRAGYSGKKVNLNAYSRRDGSDQTYGGNLKTNLGPINISGNVNYNPKRMQDYNIAANVDLLNSTKLNPNRGNLNLSGSYGASRNNEGGMNPNYRIGLNYTNSFKEGGETDHDDDKEMVNGVASILRRVKDKKNRLQLANQLSKQFDREKVKYDLPSFLKKSKVKK